MTATEQMENKAEEKGKDEGRKEEKIIIAINLKRMRLGMDAIVEATGLSVDEIEEL